ncbi:hypothetical protein FRB99_009002 [Tulasnella sp. 403]|nr:hypothetical protein FRB99_009002 [Tulasnella sp. 403]
MADAWNTEDSTMAPANGNGNSQGDNGWNNVSGGDEHGKQSGNSNGAGYRRSRSRSPGVGGRDNERSGRGDSGVNPGNNLHVSGLSSRVDNRDLEVAFGKYGKVAKAAVMYDPHTRESRGFGFVTMETPTDAEACVNGLSGTDLKGRTITVEKARRGRARTPTPGRYFGPPKRSEDYERPYDPRPYDSRYSDRGGYGRYDDRRGGGYDDRYGPPPSRYGYDDRRYDDRRYDDRRYDDKRYDDRERRRYDDRR